MICAGDQGKALIFAYQDGSYLATKTADFKAKYRTLCNFITKLIKLQPDLDYEIKKLNYENEFGSYVSSLSDRDDDRAMAYLFFAPEPESIKEDEITSSSLIEIGDLASAKKNKGAITNLVLINNMDDNEELVFQNQSEVLSDCINEDNERSPLETIWNKIPHFSVNNIHLERVHMKASIFLRSILAELFETEAPSDALKETQDPVAVDNASTDTGTGNNQDRVISPTNALEHRIAEYTIENLEPEIQKKLRSINWTKAYELQAKEQKRRRYIIMQKLLQGETILGIAQGLEQRVESLWKAIQAFHKYKVDFFKGIDLNEITIESEVKS